MKGALSAPRGRQGQAGDGVPGVGRSLDPPVWLLCTFPLLPGVRESICLLRLVVRLGQLLQGQNRGLSDTLTLGTIRPS